ncbi:MAG: alpha/beta fold hydrolase, partial [Candidatus Methylomirabilia bacterium]
MQITVNGLSIHYTLEGPPSGPVITMSHSLAANLSMWDPQLPALSSRYRVLRYDTRGHGGTEVSEEPYSLDRLVEDARALLQALGITRTHFIGLSMGGMVAQILALRAPELLESLVLCDTTSRVPPEAKPTWDERIGTAQRDGMAPLVEPTIGRWFT